MLSFNIIACVINIISIPLHIILIKAMLKLKDSFSKGFYSVVIHLSVAHILIALIMVFVEFPISFIGVSFILEKSTNWNWIVGQIITIRTGTLILGMQLIMIVMTLNRLFAVVFPIRFYSTKNSLVNRICWGIWIWSIVFRLPFVWPLKLKTYHPIDFPEKVIYNFENNALIPIYIYSGVFVGFATVMTFYISYTIIGVKVFVSNILGDNSLKPGVKRSTISSILSSFGILASIFVIAAEDFYWNSYQKDIVSTETYYIILDYCLVYTLIALPSSMFLLFPKLRQELAGVLHIPRFHIVVVRRQNASNPSTKLF